MPPLVVFSHLRWDFVYQRPQHLLTRLARNRTVYVVEEPVYAPGAPPRLERSRPAQGVVLLRPHTPVEEGGFCDAQEPVLRALLDAFVAEEGLGLCLLWFYTPMALPLADAFMAVGVVYDCMDELAAFAFAPPQLLAREQALLDRADLVFTGGPSLYEAKRDRHPDVHCFPSSVERERFGLARGGRLPDPDDQAALAPPRLGYFGVVDERMDLDVLRALAETHPEWAVVVVGPVVKIDPATLPQAPNLHYLGQRAYHQLPAYLSGWDVALLPFARNESTRYISPTKTLEYMAAEVPIVSTPIADVVGPYGELVYLGDTPAAFVAACERALRSSAAERERRAAGMRDVLDGTSWDRTAARMETLLDDLLLARAA